jgi:Helitron helicase-like domain at N-terminus
MKVNHLLHDLKRKQIFGRYCGSVWTIEYQKRGLPHLHLLLFLYPYDRDSLLDPAVVNRFVCAEIPRPENDPDGLLTGVVTRMMVHGPCGQHNPQVPCMVAKAAGLSCRPSSQVGELAAAISSPAVRPDTEQAD